jgi:transcriptional regulator of PTS gene
LKTSFGSFSEVGHLVLYPESGKKCTCGATGCLETAAALWALIPELAKNGHSFPEEEAEFEDYFNRKKIHNHVSIKHAVDAVAQALSILQTIFLPDRIVTYGPLLSNEEIFSAVVKKVKQRTPAFAAGNLRIDYIDRTFEGDIIGGSTELFVSAFRKHLIAD